MQFIFKLIFLDIFNYHLNITLLSLLNITILDQKTIKHFRFTQKKNAKKGRKNSLAKDTLPSTTTTPALLTDCLTDTPETDCEVKKEGNCT